MPDTHIHTHAHNTNRKKKKHKTSKKEHPLQFFLPIENENHMKIETALHAALSYSQANTLILHTRTHAHRCMHDMYVFVSGDNFLVDFLKKSPRQSQPRRSSHSFQAYIYLPIAAVSLSHFRLQCLRNRNNHIVCQSVESNAISFSLQQQKQ